MKELKSVTAEEIKAATGCFYEITRVALVNPRCCRGTTPFQSVPSSSGQSFNRSAGYGMTEDMAHKHPNFRG